MVEWYCPDTHNSFGVTVAPNTQKSLWTKLFEDVDDSDVFSGVMVGGQIYVDLYTGTALNVAPEIWVMVLPTGVTTGDLTTEANRVHLQEYVWLYGRMRPGDTTGNRFAWHYKLSTKRRFERNANLAIVLINRDQGITMPTSTQYNIQLDLYVQRD